MQTSVDPVLFVLKMYFYGEVELNKEFKDEFILNVVFENELELLSKLERLVLI